MLCKSGLLSRIVNTNNSRSQDYTTNPDDHSNHNIDSPRFKPFTVIRKVIEVSQSVQLPWFNQGTPILYAVLFHTLPCEQWPFISPRNISSWGYKRPLLAGYHTFAVIAKFDSCWFPIHLSTVILKKYPNFAPWKQALVFTHSIKCYCRNITANEVTYHSRWSWQWLKPSGLTNGLRHQWLFAEMWNANNNVWELPFNKPVRHFRNACAHRDKMKYSWDLTKEQ